MASKKQIWFKEAYVRLKEIESEIETEEIIDVDKLSKLQKEAEELYKIASSKLEKIK